MPNRKRTSITSPSKTVIYIVLFFIFIAVVLSSVMIGYYFGYDDAKQEALKRERAKDEKRASVLKNLEQTSSKKDDLDVNSRLKEVLKKESKTTLPDEDKNITQDTNSTKEVVKETAKKDDKSKEADAASKYEDASHEIEDEILPMAPKREVVLKSTQRAKLAIIIDDVSVKSHVVAINALNLPITMSFLPPSDLRPNSHTLAAKEKFYMVHLPMEAKKFKAEEPSTLRVDDSQEKIAARVAGIKKLFPNVAYINNHAGSKFTSDEKAVGRLIHVLNEYNINFIDSRTIGDSQVEKVMKSYKKEYVSRDVFLDHKVDKSYIKLQIKKAIEVAKKHGSAIAIGHPHENTIAAISESKHLFKDIELVLVDKLYQK